MFDAAVSTIAFYSLMVFAVAMAIATVFTRRIFRSALYLMGTLTASAAFYILLSAEFLAGVQILVYVGGIVVLIVFAVMLTSSSELLEAPPSPLRKLLAYVAALAFYAMTASMILATKFDVSAKGPDAAFNSTAEIGKKLLNTGADGYVLPFEVLSLLLLGVLIAAIVVARKKKGIDD